MSEPKPDSEHQNNSGCNLLGLYFLWAQVIISVCVFTQTYAHKHSARHRNSFPSQSTTHFLFLSPLQALKFHLGQDERHRVHIKWAQSNMSLLDSLYTSFSGWQSCELVAHWHRGAAHEQHLLLDIWSTVFLQAQRKRCHFICLERDVNVCMGEQHKHTLDFQVFWDA